MNSIFETWRKLLSEAKATPGCKLPNRGDIAEGIVAAAIVAKLSAREDGVVGIHFDAKAPLRRPDGSRTCSLFGRRV